MEIYYNCKKNLFLYCYFLHFNGSKNGGYFSCKTDFTDCTKIEDTLGECPCHLAVDGNDVYIVNYLSGNIVKNFKRVIYHSGKGVNLPRQDMSHTHFVGFSPDKKYVIYTDLGLDAIFLCDRDLNEVSFLKVPDGYGVRHFAFSKDGKYIYAVNELVPSISTFSYYGGKANYLNTVKLDCKVQNSTAAAIRLGKEKDMLFVSVRGENKVYALKAQAEKVDELYNLSCRGVGPRDFVICNDLCIVCNEKSNDVAIFNLKNDKHFVSLIKDVAAPLCCIVI